LVTLVTITLLTSAAVTASGNLQLIFAQPPAQPQSPQPQPQQQQKAPLNFYLKLADNSSSAQAASQATANGTGTKNMTVTVNVQKGPGGQLIPLPISAVVPSNIQPQDLQLCASLADDSESCQPLSGGQQGASIDLTQGAGAAPTPSGMASPAPAPQSYPNSVTNAINPIVDIITSSFTMQHADAQLISVEDTTINIPVTVIVPIDLNIQNAQVCASVLSGGDQSCTQIVLNPEQTSYTNVDVDLSTATPTLTTGEQDPNTAALTTAEPTTSPTQTAPTTTEPTTTEPTTTEPTTTEPTTTEPTTTEEPSTDTDTTEEPSTDGGTSEGGTE
jgi:hypothetical protein